MRTLIELSPLEQIRQAEAEVTRRVAAVREAGERSITEARHKAQRTILEARQQGELEGEARRKEIIAGAEEEAQEMTVQAQRRAELIRQRGRGVMESALEAALSVILGDCAGPGETGGER
jgi:vacuolar-type H+-ATPase subunit H